MNETIEETGAVLMGRRTFGMGHPDRGPDEPQVQHPVTRAHHARMIPRALLAWLAMLVFAILNGALRQALLIPRIGERAAHVVSTLLLSAIILGVAWASLPWLRPTNARDAWMVGALWLGLTVAFEFLGGHYLFGDPWERLLAAYNVAQGQVWVLVLIATLLAPVLAYGMRHRSS